MRKFSLLILLALLPLTLSCGDTDPTDPLKAGAPSDLISDANQNYGNKSFFWLAPVVKNNTFDGVFNPQLKPLVVICELDLAANPATCVADKAPLATWSMGGGLELSLDGQHYGFEWHTDQTETDFNAAYRIQVFMTERPDAERLGYADVQFFNNGQDLKDINTDEYIELRDGRTLPGRFRIEKGASCEEDVDCGEALIGPDGGTVTTESGFAGVEVPAGAVDGDILITIGRVDPNGQPWGRCLPTGLRQEEGCYDFDTEPSINEVNQQDTFKEDVVVAVCLDPNATREDYLALHKYDPENRDAGVVELASASEDFLTCDGFAHEGPSGFFGHFASAARRVLGPVAGFIGGRPLYATDAGRGGTTDSFSFVGWAEPVTVGLAAAAPEFALPEAVISPRIALATDHNHPAESITAADGATLRFEYASPTDTTVLDTLKTGTNGEATPTWALTPELGTHVLTVSTRMKIEVENGDSVVVPDPTPLFTVSILTFENADACPEGSDCIQALVGPDGGTVTTELDRAGVAIPAGAVDDTILVTVKRIDPAAQDWGRCLPTGLRQEEGCYEFDTEPALIDVNDQDAFNGSVVVAVCIVSGATRPDRLTLHKYDPEKPDNGVVELASAQETFLNCDNYTLEGSKGILGSFASAVRRGLTPVREFVIGKPLYATDAGRGGTTDSFSFIGWAEPVTLALTTEPDATTVGVTDVVVTAQTVHNHDPATGALIPAVESDSTLIRFEYTDPSNVTTVDTVITRISQVTGAAEARIQLSSQAGIHNVRVSTQQEILLDSEVIISGAATGLGMFAAPSITFAGTPFLVPDPTIARETGEITVLGRVSLWNAEETDFLADAIGPNHGINEGTVARVPGLSGDGFGFTGTSGAFSAGVANFGDATAWTLAAWVKLDPMGDPLTIQRFVTMNNEKGVLRQNSVDFETDARQLHFFGNFGGTEPSAYDLRHIQVNTALQAGCWHHVVGTYDGAQLALYLDGEPKGTQTDLPVGNVTANRIHFGSSPEELFGVLDEIEVHNHALSATQVDSAYQEQDVPSCGIGVATGQVTDDLGNALQGASVTVDGTAIGTHTDAEGSYLLRDVPSGEQTLSIGMTGYQAETRLVSIPSGGTVSESVTLMAWVFGQVITPAVEGSPRSGIPEMQIGLERCGEGSSAGRPGTCVPTGATAVAITDAFGDFRSALGAGFWRVVPEPESAGYAGVQPASQVVAFPVTDPKGAGPQFEGLVVDQEQPELGIEVNAAIGGDSHQLIAQVFRAGFSARVAEIRAPVTCSAGDGNDVTVSIQTVEDSLPTGTIVGNAAVIPGADLAGSLNGELRNIALDGSVQLTAEAQYALVFSAATAAECSLTYAGPTRDSYVRGLAMFHSAPNDGWVRFSHEDWDDMPFQILVF